MRLANVQGRATLVVDGQAVDVEQASGGTLSSDPMMLSDLGHHGALRALDVSSADWPVLDEGRLGPPVPRPSKGFGVALNYRSHAIESNLQIPEEPHLFAKTPNCVAGPFEDIVVPAGRTKVDYEAEVVIVFGRRCHAATTETAWDHLAGVMCGQDISDRGEQFRPPVRQFTIAKSYDTFGPIGPYLVTPEELTDRDSLDLEGRLNGATMQHSDTSDLIFAVPALVVWLSRFITFETGDLVWTGTPGGVGEAQDPPRFLRDGDELETTVEGVGTMRNVVVER